MELIRIGKFLSIFSLWGILWVPLSWGQSSIDDQYDVELHKRRYDEAVRLFEQKSSDLNQQKNELDRLKTRLRQAVEKKSRIERELPQKRQDRDQYQNEIPALERDISNLRTTMRQNQATIDTLTQRLNDAISQESDLERELTGLRQQLSRLENSDIERTIARLEAALRSKRDELERAKTEKSQAESSLRSSENQLAALQQKLRELEAGQGGNEQRRRELQNEKARVERLLNAEVAKGNQLSERIRNESTKLRDYQNTYARECSRRDGGGRDGEDRPGNPSVDCAALEGKINDQKALITLLSSHLEDSKDEQTAHRNRIGEINRELESLGGDQSDEIRRVKQQITETQSRITDLGQKVTNAEQRINQLTAEISQLSSDLEAAKQSQDQVRPEIERLKQEIRLKQQELDDARRVSQGLRQAKEQMEGENRTLASELRSKETRISDLKRKIQDLEAAIERDRRDLEVAEADIRNLDTEIDLQETKVSDAQLAYQNAETHKNRSYDKWQEVKRNYDRALADSKLRGGREGKADGEREGVVRAEVDGPRYGKEDGELDGKADGERDGWQKGLANGYREGHALGYQESFGAGEQRGRTMGTADGERKGQAAGLQAGYDEGFQEGRDTGYDDGYAAGHSQEAYDEGFDAGLIKGEQRAIETANREDYPKGYQTALKEIRASAPGSTEIIDMKPEAPPQPLKLGIGELSGDIASSTLALRLPANGVLRMGRHKGHVAEPDYRFRRNPPSDLGNHPDFVANYRSSYLSAYQQGMKQSYRQTFDDLYERNYDDKYQGAYDDAYEAHYQPGYDRGYANGYDQGKRQGDDAGYNQGYQAVYQAAYQRAYDQNVTVRFEEGRQDGYASGYAQGKIEGHDVQYQKGLTQGESEGFAQHIENARNLAYQAGYEKAAQEYRKGNKTELVSIKLRDKSGDLKLDEGEALGVEVDVRNFGDQSLEDNRMSIKVLSHTPNVALNGTAQKFPIIQSDTAVTFRNVVFGTAKQTQAGGVDLTVEVFLDQVKIGESRVKMAFVAPPPQPDPVDIIKKGDLWSYFDQKSVASGWKVLDFNDAAWKKGQAPLGYDAKVKTTIGYGGDKKKKFMAAYFRKSFTIGNLDAIKSLTAAASFDDGVVVYLNGREIMRQNMPKGEINPETPAEKTIDGDEHGKFTQLNLGKQLLVQGVNVVAVEVHQRKNDSSDLYFDFFMKLVK